MAEKRSGESTPERLVYSQVFLNRFRAVSSGVEHCIHTAGVASSKLALPTNLLVMKKAPSGNARCFFLVSKSVCFEYEYVLT